MSAKIIIVMSPKGGVGKTTTAVNLAAAMANLNKKTLLIDANLETPHVAVYYGFVGFKYSIEDLLNGNAKIEDVIYTGDNPNLHILPSRVSKDIDDRSINKLINLNIYLKELEKIYDFIIIDSKPSYDITFIKLIKDAKSLIVCNPDITSIIEAKKIKEGLDATEIEAIGLVLNRTNTRIKEQIQDDAASDLTKIKSVFKVRDDNVVYRALHVGIPVVILSPNSLVARDITNIAKNIIKI